MASPYHARISSLGPVWDLHGPAHMEPIQDFTGPTHAKPVRNLHGPAHMGPARDLTGLDWEPGTRFIDAH